MVKTIEPWIQTFTGIKFWLTNPRIEDICIEDISHALSMICRYSGHSKFFYSVAQHSVIASTLCEDDIRLAVLLHDASEAYLGDVTKPLKCCFGGKYSYMEDKIQSAINYKYGLCLYPSDILKIKMADLQMLKLEATSVLMNEPIEDWHIDLPDQHKYINISVSWDPEYAKKCFMKRFFELSDF